MLPPCNPKTFKVVKNTEDPRRVPIKITGMRQGTGSAVADPEVRTYYVTPEWTPPTLANAEDVEAALVDNVALR